MRMSTSTEPTTDILIQVLKRAIPSALQREYSSSMQTHFVLKIYNCKVLRVAVTDPEVTSLDNPGF
jgi:hypothetical protein